MSELEQSQARITDAKLANALRDIARLQYEKRSLIEGSSETIKGLQSENSSKGERLMRYTANNAQLINENTRLLAKVNAGTTTLETRENIYKSSLNEKDQKIKFLEKELQESDKISKIQEAHEAEIIEVQQRNRQTLKKEQRQHQESMQQCTAQLAEAAETITHLTGKLELRKKIAKENEQRLNEKATELSSKFELQKKIVANLTSKLKESEQQQILKSKQQTDEMARLEQTINDQKIALDDEIERNRKICEKSQEQMAEIMENDRIARRATELERKKNSAEQLELEELLRKSEQEKKAAEEQLNQQAEEIARLGRKVVDGQKTVSKDEKTKHKLIKQQAEEISQLKQALESQKTAMETEKARHKQMIKQAEARHSDLTYKCKIESQKFHAEREMCKKFEDQLLAIKKNEKKSTQDIEIEKKKLNDQKLEMDEILRSSEQLKLAAEDKLKRKQFYVAELTVTHINLKSTVTNLQVQLNEKDEQHIEKMKALATDKNREMAATSKMAEKSQKEAELMAIERNNLSIELQLLKKNARDQKNVHLNEKTQLNQEIANLKEIHTSAIQDMEIKQAEATEFYEKHIAENKKNEENAKKSAEEFAKIAELNKTEAEEKFGNLAIKLRQTERELDKYQVQAMDLEELYNTDTHSYQKEIAMLKEKLESHKSSIEEQKKNQQLMSDLLKKRNSEIECMKKKYQEEKNNEKKSQNAQLYEIEEYGRIMEQQNNEAKNKIVDLNSKLHKAGLEQLRLQATVDEQKKAHVQVEREALTEIRRLEETVKEMKITIEAVENKIIKKDSKIAALKSTLKELTTEKEANEGNHLSSREQIQEIARLNTAMVEMQQAHQIEQLKFQQSRRDRKSNNQKAILKVTVEKRKEIEELNNQIHSLNNEIEDLKEKLTANNVQIEEYKELCALMKPVQTFMAAKRKRSASRPSKKIRRSIKEEVDDEEDYTPEVKRECVYVE